MNKKQAYQTIAKHIYAAYRTYAPGSPEIMILADSLEEARKKAEEAFQTSLVTVNKIEPTKDSQVYYII